MVRCRWCHLVVQTKWGAKAKISPKCSLRIVFPKRLPKQFRHKMTACFLTPLLVAHSLRKEPILKICSPIKRNMPKDLKDKEEQINKLTLNYLVPELSSHSCVIDLALLTNAESLSLFILIVSQWARTTLAWMLSEATWIQVNPKRSSMIVSTTLLKKRMPKTIHRISMRMILSSYHQRRAQLTIGNIIHMDHLVSPQHSTKRYRKTTDTIQN